MEENRLNILQVHNYYQIHGGEDEVAENERIMLENQGHKVYVYSRNNSELNNMSLISKIFLPFSAIFSMKTYREICKIIREEKIDIVHVHNTLLLVSPSVFYAAFRCRVPVVQTLHNFRMLCPAGSFFRDGKVCEECSKGKLIPAIKHRCYRDSLVQSAMSAAILAIHRFWGTYRKIYYICLTPFNEKKILQLNHGKRKIVDPKKIFLKPNFTFDAKKQKCGAEYYLWIGRLEPLKGIMLTISAFSKMAGKKLIVMGDGPLRETISNYIQDNDIQNIVLEGYVPRKDLEEKYAKAKALIVSSQCYETFGLVIAEAYAHGVPAIVGNIGNIGAMVEHGVTGFKFQYDSESALIQAVGEFERSDQKTISENARKVYVDRFKAESNASRLEQIYYEIIKDYMEK